MLAKQTNFDYSSSKVITCLVELHLLKDRTHIFQMIKSLFQIFRNITKIFNTSNEIKS